MTYCHQIINPRHIYIGEYQPPALMYSYNESKMPAPYQTRRRDVNDEDKLLIPRIVEGVNTTEKVRSPPFEPYNPYHYEGDINYLLTQLVYSVYKNDGIPSSIRNKLICKFGDYIQMNIFVYQNDNGTYEIDFLRIIGDRNIINELKTKILCDVNTDFFSHHSHL